MVRQAHHERVERDFAIVLLYQAVRLHVNYFQFSFKLLEKIRDGARVIKRYSPPATPCDRLMQGDTITAKPESTDGQGWTGRGHWKGERK